MATEKNEKSSSTTSSTTTPAPDAPPEIIGDPKEHLLTSPHDMTEDVDPAYAGDYQIVHGLVRIAVPDGKGGFDPRGKVYCAGAKLRLGHLDAYRMLESGTVRRVDGKKPDKVGEPLTRETPAAPPTAPGGRQLHIRERPEGEFVALRTMRTVHGDLVLSGERCDASDETARVLLLEGSIKRFEPSGGDAT